MDNKPSGATGKAKEKKPNHAKINGLMFYWNETDFYVKAHSSARHVEVTVGFINDKGERAPKQ